MILHYDDNLPSWASAILVWATGSPVCYSCAAPGSQSIFHISKQGTSVLPVYFGLFYLILTVGLLVHWE